MVSVILPNYNHAPFLEKRIESILKQTYDNFELIILDDQSNDDSRSIIEKYRSHEKVSQILYNDTNSGNTFLQWNKGFSFAKSEYIWIAESDDVADPRLLEILVAELKQNKCATIAVSHSYLIDQNDQIIHDKNNNIGHLTVDGKKFIRQKMLKVNRIQNASAVVFRREAIQNLIPLYQELRYTGDWLFWIELLAKGNIIFVSEKLNYFRQHNNKVSNRSSKDPLFLSEALKVIVRTDQLIKLSYWERIILLTYRYREIKKRRNLLSPSDLQKLLEEWSKYYNYKRYYLYLVIYKIAKLLPGTDHLYRT